MKKKCRCGQKADKIVLLDNVQHILCEKCAINVTVDATIKGKNVAITAFTPSKMLTITAAGEMLGIHPNTIRRWADQGLIKAYRLGPRRDRRFNRDEVEKWLAGSQASEARKPHN